MPDKSGAGRETINTPFVHAPHDRPFVERRKRRDAITIAIQVFSVAAWVLAAVVLIVIALAQPSQMSFIERYLQLSVRGLSLNESYMTYALMLLMITFGLCAFGIIFNLLRHKRKTDRYRPSLFLLGAGSLMGSVAMIVLIM